MSQTQYTQAERGGGDGATGRMRAAILNQINSWVASAQWANPDRADRLFEKVNEAPEKFISPNPSTNYREEASRIYDELREEHGLRLESELNNEVREWEDRAESHYDKIQAPEPEPELGGAPKPKDVDDPEPDEPAPEPKEPEPAEEPEPAGATDKAVRESIRRAENTDKSNPDSSPYTGVLGTVRLYVTWLVLKFLHSQEIREVSREIETLRLNLRYYRVRALRRYKRATGRAGGRAVGGNQS